MICAISEASSLSDKCRGISNTQLACASLQHLQLNIQAVVALGSLMSSSETLLSHRRCGQ